MRNQFCVRSLTVVCGLLTVVLFAVAGCQRPVSPASSAPRAVAASVTPAAVYVGEAACAGCHAAEFREHSVSHHARTLHLINPSVPTDVDPPQGPIDHTQLSLGAFAGEFTVSVKDNLNKMQTLKLAFGSGKIGITYAAPMDGATLLEMHKSWFPHEHRWATTLGQEYLAANSLGRVRHDARQCLLCHAVTVAAGAPIPETRFLGVGCEACHGPASAHVAAMQTPGHAADPHIEHMAAWDALRLNTLCGKCHGTVQSIPNKKQQALTFRTQPIGLMTSRCYTATRGGISCLNCHDPHGDASSNVRSYEAACLSCHAVHPTQQQTAKVAPAETALPCPVNAHTGCIKCHMPPREIMPGSGVAATMTDHHIAIYHGH